MFTVDVEGSTHAQASGDFCIVGRFTKRLFKNCRNEKMSVRGLDFIQAQKSKTSSPE